MCVSYRELSLATNPLIFGAQPSSIQRLSDGFAVTRKYMSSVFSFLIIYHIKCDAVQHNKLIVGVLHLLTGNDEYGIVELWNIDFPVSLQVADFTVSTSSVYCKQRHAGKMRR